MPTREEIRTTTRTLWQTGDYSKVAYITQPLGDALVIAADIRPGSTVLDAATGTGHVALAAARRFCDVTGLDIVPELLEVARARAAAEGLDVRFVEGDVQELTFPDASFDYVCSAIGAMFAPDQEATASELFRVCKPGGTVAMLNWIPGGFLAEMFKVIAAYAPPPPGSRPAVQWGSEERLRELFPAAEQLSVKPGTLIVRAPSTPFYTDFMLTHYGPTRKLADGLPEDKRASFARELEAVFERFNTAGDGTFALQSDYVVALIRKRA